MDTLLLNPTTWDLTLDATGNIAVAQNPYSLAQDAASAIKLYRGEAWYDNLRGVPYYPTILGEAPPLSLLKALFVDAALTVPEVVAAQAFIQSFVDRKITGQVQVTNVDGLIIPATF